MVSSHAPYFCFSLLTRLPSNSDYNYEIKNDNTCDLVPGLAPIDHSEVCAADASRISYFDGRGYRKIPISTCTGGDERKLLGEELPCPGHTLDEDPRHRGLSGFWFFVLVVLLPAAAAAAVGYWVFTRWADGSFGRIRLGDSAGGGAAGGSVFDAQRPWIQYPVMAVSAAVAVVVAAPMVLVAAARAVAGWFGGGRRYTSRQSFARGRGEYAVVDPDEDELLGDDEEEGDGV